MNTSSSPTPVTVDIVSDVVCPWCFVGKRKLEQALALNADLRAAPRWRPYQLDPSIPPDGLDRRAYMERKFGGGDKIAQIHRRLNDVGHETGIRFAFDAIKRSPNTLDAHRLIRWAESAGAQDAVVERLFKAYFEDGRDIGDRAVLAEIAAAAGMDSDVVAKLLAGDADKSNVREEIAAAQRLGVTGVPFFIIGGRYAVAGAQSPEVLASAMRGALKPQADATVA